MVRPVHNRSAGTIRQACRMSATAQGGPDPYPIELSQLLRSSVMLVIAAATCPCPGPSHPWAVAHGVHPPQHDLPSLPVIPAAHVGVGAGGELVAVRQQGLGQAGARVQRLCGRCARDGGGVRQGQRQLLAPDPDLRLAVCQRQRDGEDKRRLVHLEGGGGGKGKMDGYSRPPTEPRRRGPTRSLTN